MKKIFLILLLLQACTSNRYEEDKTNPHYAEGKNIALLTPSPQSPYPVTQSLAESTAIVGVVASAVGLAANRDYYRGTSITGRTVCRSKAGENLEIPCGPIEVVLEDKQHKALSRIQVENQSFVFKVPKGKAFHLKAVSKHYKQVETKDSYQGDDVVLNLVKK